MQDREPIMKQSRFRVTSALLIACLLAAASCVNVDPETGQTIPRGNQRYEFEEVTHNAKDLKVGMTKLEAMMLLGSPAERSQRGDVWVYLPERPAVIVPGRALRLDFRDGKLEKFGYHAIVLGKPL
jgi:outer membrane protein assembly factor BamE (lipoprotein component of BamABCDE complex)